ncbi:MAG: hypothetical protein ACETWG_07770 [Candidatus Neomarinimicrobiota bacterium]
MDLKDKLNLLWKYLFLAVVLAFVILLFVSRAGYRDRFPRAFYGHPHAGMSFIHEGGDLDKVKDIRVEKKITDKGDTTVSVWVNGKKVDNPEEYLKKIEQEFKSGDIHILKWKDEQGKKVKKKVRVEVKEEEDED